MREILNSIDTWHAAGRRVALATVVEVWGSAPRPLGSKMAISDRGEMAGSVSGGCVEGAVVEEALAVLADGVGKMVRYGVDNETAWSVGLSCGGNLGVYVEPLDGPPVDGTHFDTLATAVRRETLAVRGVVLEGPNAGRRALAIFGEGVDGGAEIRGELEGGDREGNDREGDDLGARFSTLAPEVAADFRPRRLPPDAEGGDVLFLDPFPPRRKLVVVGAVHVAIPLVTFAASLGFRTVVVDPRTAFATRERFPHADTLDTRWPDEALDALGLDENTFVALLSHDFKLDLPALEVALRRPVRYVGALGSKKTHKRRVAALEERGFDADAIARIHNPIGLDLGGRRAEEIAVAVIAEMVAVDHGRDLP